MKNFILAVAAACIILGAILEGASFTGLATYEEAAGELCLWDSDCGGQGLACCPVKDQEAGICFNQELCSSVFYFTEADRLAYLQQIKSSSAQEGLRASSLVPAILFMLGLAFIYLYLNLPHVHVLEKRKLGKKKSTRQ